uniref:Uncharacterized protein n=1 Tax=Pithovirus LCPAC104 TaxID=2506589 RepID=A0A481Z4T4_9VIRU|nr:MAG: hypothetical protein LCPAC104_00210 [Pithovirus LCPAC104]
MSSNKKISSFLEDVTPRDIFKMDLDTTMESLKLALNDSITTEKTPEIIECKKPDNFDFVSLSIVISTTVVFMLHKLDKKFNISELFFIAIIVFITVFYFSKDWFTTVLIEPINSIRPITYKIEEIPNDKVKLIELNRKRIKKLLS